MSAMLANQSAYPPESWETLLDFSGPLNVPLFDHVVMQFFQGKPDLRTRAQHVLTALQDHPDAWTRVDTILEQAQVTESKFLGLKILEALISTKWKILPAEQRDGIKNYVVAQVIASSSSDEALRNPVSKHLLGKLNLVLVQILKQDWPANWPNFIPELVAASRTSIPLCQNNMAILQLLSEEIFDFSAEGMTQTKARTLKQQLCSEFTEVFNLCLEVLTTADGPQAAPLVLATLSTLLRFLNWIPLGYVFQTGLIEKLTSRFLAPPAFRNVTLKCLTEIAALEPEGVRALAANANTSADVMYAQLFTTTMEVVATVVPLEATDFADLWENGSNDAELFIQTLANFLVTFLAQHGQVLERQSPPAAEAAHQYLARIARVQDDEILKTVLDYWTPWTEGLYNDQVHQGRTIGGGGATATSGIPGFDPLLNLGGAMGAASLNPEAHLRKSLYPRVLQEMRIVCIESMTRPEEVLVAENEEGVVVRVTLKDQDMLVIYNLLKKVLVFLTHLDPYNMQEIMIGKLARQIDNSEWSWVNLNKLCWAIGSVSGAMSEDHEKSFLVNVIKDLLGLVDQKRGKDNKAIVAANIMYVVGQYPRFLKAHWRFLKTVVKKLFEFMHETHDGVQDMACDTYIKIAGKTKKCFVVQQAGEPVPFIEEILAHLPAHTAHLNPTQVQTFFEATGILIAAQPNLQQQARLVKDLMKLPNATWDDNMNTASKGIPILESPDHVKTLVQILRVNSAACKTVGAGFELQMEHIYKDMLGMYAASSKVILETLQKDPTTFMRPELRQLRAIKKETLRLVETYMTAAKADAAMLAEQRVLPLLEVTLGDYAQSPPVTRDAEVLTVLATIIDTKLQSYMNAHVHAILGAVFGCTLEMINKELVEFPEHRVGFFRLLEVLVKHCFQAVVMLPTEQFQQLIDSLVWGFKHTMRDIGNRSLGIVETLLDQMQRAPVALANDFYQAYYMRLLQDVFFVLTDAEHRANFSAQCRVLAKLMFIVSSGSATSPLSIEQPAGVNNVEFLRDHLQRLLQNAFPHVNPKAVHVFIIGALELNTDLDRFRPHVRDFLITLREFTATGGAAAVTTADDLYLDERERELEDLKMQQHQRALAVPGLLKPSEKRDDDDDEF